MDAVTPWGMQVCAGIKVTAPLDGNGNIDGTYYLWSNEYLTPRYIGPNSNSTNYVCTVYTADGENVWENQLQVPTNGPWDLGTFIPNSWQG